MTDLSKQQEAGFILAWCIILSIGLIIICCVAHADEYTDEQIANAIRKAEGTWTYGIKSVKCETEAECRKICLRTIKNNRKRFEEYGRYIHPEYISFLASRYAPIGAGNDPQGLNKNWLRNVRFFLRNSK